ncbi:alpha-amylase family glycosyl hydrolase [Oceanispirochaeta sp.]|jgi:glycosidase|uniref:alpha-amylase family glycosyl hydrolase n=1 Tax=Oceanispirochaeta sp. TaxID=2035350 RepID=UPI00260B1ED2|nr:alpha-amylase family glycosyl hydrolase [Oceanispirochaeta sp.]MDA3956454.1 alpha-amylase family glycosyl hydrolase [Oceanispirochaeta sp.]
MSSGLYIEKTILNTLKLTDLHLSDHQMLIVSSQIEARQLALEINERLSPPTFIKAGELYMTAMLIDFYSQAVNEYMKALRGIHGPLTLKDMIPPEFEGAWNALLSRMDENYPAGKRFDLSTDPLKLESRLTSALILKLLNGNEGCKNLKLLFPDKTLQGKAYNSLLDSLMQFISASSLPLDWEIPLTEILLTPSRLYPGSLEEQIRYITNKYGFIKNKTAYLSALDLSREENKIGLSGPGPVEGIDLSFHEDDIAHFSIDSDWMPNLILLAKNCYVWLNQLSDKHKRDIKTLNDIPGEELDEISRRGITGLWLIGIWKRSTASRTIKRVCGNPEAEASAYSLKNYTISEDLGAREALQALTQRCLQKGIRLASDMVPNHTGIDSDWMIEKPDYFLQTNQSPYPGYTFQGLDLSPDPRIGLFLEDGYYDKSDASVVFMREDRVRNEKKYIYHGNDGTSMPWNDTAQLDFMNPLVREELINLILQVAEHFPIIRFDAAMTLARKHIQRLWYPQPGDGGAIPSRSAYSMTEKEFREHMPEEFWREVVDRINSEAPNTLLLAEAFWMMEGYFVRNLGMHRVYNSAFMNLLKMEENKGFRKLLKDTLKSNPRILKRFVNFMNNPDEDTAVSQFGKGDKYFGICTLLVTLPGLPMIGHGQFEGLSEKYGMEYRRAYFNEEPDQELMNRHEREIYPLMKIRLLFAGARQFHLFDFLSRDSINEDVYAYCNSLEEQHALVLFNNSNTLTEGTIQNEVIKGINSEGGERLGEVSDKIGSILNLNPNSFTLLFETKKRLWYIHRNRDILERGLPVKLYGYQCKVFYPIRQQEDDEERRLEKLILKVGGRGVPDLNRALTFSELEPLIHMMKTFLESRVIDTPVMSDLITGLSKKLNRIRKILDRKVNPRNKRVIRREQTVLEDIIRPSFMSLMLCDLDDNRLFYMARFYQRWTEEAISDIDSIKRFWKETLKSSDFTSWFGINQYKDILWYNKECMDEAFWWFSTLSSLSCLGRKSSENDYGLMTELSIFLSDLQKIISESEYRISQILV